MQAKPTTALLAAGIYHPTRGSVQLDGKSLTDYDTTSLRQAIAVISQDTFLLHASLRTNLQLGAPTTTDHQIHQALKTARLAELVAQLPAGLDTLVGDRGYRLSGGERQRLALARALLQQPDVIIMDEATAYLDVTTEQAISQAIKTHLSGTIRLVIAHRLSTIRSADQIIVLDHGATRQRGIHTTLATTPGLYVDLLRDDGATSAQIRP